MKHNLKISVSKAPQSGGVLACRSLDIRERVLRFLFGAKQRITVLIPSESVQEVAICEVAEGGEHFARG